MKYLSRIVYVDGECVYNNKDFWTKEAPTILEEFEEHEALDFMGKPVDKVRFETEFNSNSSRIANIDGVAGEVDYNITFRYSVKNVSSLTSRQSRRLPSLRNF